MEEIVRKRNKNSSENFYNLIFIDKYLSLNPDTWKKYNSFRNIVAHKNSEKEFHITEEGLQIFKTNAESIINPPKANEKCSRPYAVNCDINFCDVLTHMKKKNYSNVPIIDTKNQVIGIINYYTLFNYYNDNCEDIASLPRELQVCDILDYCKLDNNPDIKYEFIWEKEDIYKVYELFRSNNSKVKIEACILTDNGKKTGKLVGIITPWDLLD